MRLALLAAAVLANVQAEPPPGFKALFNGKDLEGWVGGDTTDPKKFAAMSAEDRDKWTADMRAHWKAENGEFVNDGKGKYATTAQDYGDIEFRIDYKTVAKADSGIYLRGVPQVQIWDYTKEGGKHNIGADKGSGGLWNNRPGTPGKDPLVLADKPFGEWNAFRIIQVGSRTSIWLNEKLVVDHAILENFWDKDRKTPIPPKGPIQLQTHGGEIRWRNVFVKELSSDEANAILAKKGDEGFESAFNGKDLDGWAGAVDNYEVKDGAILCKPGKGGVLHTKGEYGDFVARLEFKVPPGGNNGLAIRYPGQGDTAYSGMCELQVLDDSSPKYAKLDPRQYHGSIYGMVAATRGYQRPVGDWNFQEVTVKGSTITVELNGSVIVNADVSKVTEFMGGKPHPGMNRTSGSFGFAGHGDAVQFRNVRIKKL
jgi:hypothetical protein